MKGQCILKQAAILCQSHLPPASVLFTCKWKVNALQDKQPFCQMSFTPCISSFHIQMKGQCMSKWASILSNLTPLASVLLICKWKVSACQNAQQLNEENPTETTFITIQQGLDSMWIMQYRCIWTIGLSFLNVKHVDRWCTMTTARTICNINKIKGSREQILKSGIHEAAMSWIESCCSTQYFAALH